MKRKLAFLAITLFLFTANSFADIITLKSGKRVEGTILNKDNDSVKIDFGDFSSTYFLDEIESINGEKISSPGQDTASNIKEEINTQESSQDPLAMPELYNKNPDALRRERAAAEAITIGIIAIVVFIIFVIFYIYHSICLQFIAKKTGQEYPWMAWIPVANLFLMCKIAGISYWWLLAILVSFIPFLGILISLAFTAFIWYKIAIARNKPGWIGALNCLPLINLVVLGYLAFSE